jgi:hypothetical protein
MGFSIRNRLASAALVAVLAACGGSAPSKSSSGARPGNPGASFLVTVQRPTYGVIHTLGDAQIDCGPGATQTLCGPVSYAWDDVVTLVATALPGYMVGTWVGDCSGRPTNAAGDIVCVLDTQRYGSDKWVGATFGPEGRVLHPNFSDPAVHGPAFRASIARQPGSYDCKACHGGTTYDGQGIAPSCTQCHANAGYPDWLHTCNFCHDAPPAPAPVGIHPAVSSAITGCWGCHPGTVDATGTLVPGGLHMDGVVEATGGGHAAGYADPAVHSRDFFQFVSGGGGLTCTACHGPDYGNTIANGQSCNSCHAAAGWQTGGVANWKTNCAFCHGTRGPATQGGFDVASTPALAAPPDAIPQRLGGGPAPDRTGAHQLHLIGSAFAGPIACGTCHSPVPTAATALTHIHGRDTHSPVVVTAPGGTADPAAYSPATGTCATACHGAGGSPAWSSTGIACNGCHGIPPAGSTHAGISGADLTVCNGCHGHTVTAAGVIDVAGGYHVNGTVDLTGGHPAGYDAPSVHGRDFFAAVAAAGAGGTPSCAGCHGATYGNPIAAGRSCNSCHAAQGWVAGWDTNCSFCHGLKDATTQTGYAVADHPTWAAPPAALSERLTGIAAPTRTGAHVVHLSGSAMARAFTCDVCHTVPSTISHISGRDQRAAVLVRAPWQTTADPAAYDPAAGTCATACHGASGSPAWSTTGIACNGCHGTPPATASHAAVASDLTLCNGCHRDTVTAGGVIDLAGGRHLNGVVDVVSPHAAGYASPAIHARDFFQFVSGGGGLVCTSCHGATYAAPVLSGGGSCNTCHAAAGWQTAGVPNWQTNCSFCHGARNATTQAGYAVASYPGYAAPPDAIPQRLGGPADPTRTGAHQIHLAGSAMAGPFPCSTCHSPVPTAATALTHIHGRDTHSPVVVTAPGGTADPAAYNPSTGTCATSCHGTGGSPAWSTSGIACNGCHGTPPATTVHAGVAANDLTACNGCHADTVTAGGTINVSGGRHLDGTVEVASNHGTGYSTPALHGRDFFAAVAAAGSGAPSCTTCHGADYSNAIVSGQSCNSCHAGAGWATAGSPNWQTNCSFCHGARNASTQAGYAVADHPTWAAPPDAIPQRLTGAADASRTGAHAIHLTGSSYAGPFTCSACHAVPTTVAHISGRDVRATVLLTAPGQAAPQDPAGYDPVSQTCSTGCHAATRSPAWTSTGIACNGCHGIPPASSSHTGVSGADLTVCNQCHSDTVTTSGTINVASGRHINGMIDFTGHPDGFSAPSSHGPQFLNYLAGVTGTLNCQSCHGADYATPLGASGVSCNGCHTTAGWATAGVSNWQTNCSFCHGARNATTQAGYAVAANPAYAAPPDAISQRLTGTAAPTKTGAHQTHLTGKTGAAGAYPAFPCATCHPVPSTLSHVSAARQATITVDPASVFTTLTPAELGAIGTLFTYDTSGATPTCGTNYCHGATLSGRGATAAQYPPQWSTSAPAIGAAATDCSTCHGYPPPSGAHFSHVGEAVCTDCHYGVPHVNGRKDVKIVPYLNGTWYPATRTCDTGCHGTYYTWP